MRKIIETILLFIFCLILTTTSVKAESEACKITLSADKTSLKPGDEVTITLLMEDITKPTGIINLLSELELSQDIFEIQLVENEELSGEIEGLGLDILYSGENDTDLSIKSPWNLFLLEEEGKYGIIRRKCR